MKKVKTSDLANVAIHLLRRAGQEITKGEIWAPLARLRTIELLAAECLMSHPTNEDLADLIICSKVQTSDLAKKVGRKEDAIFMRTEALEFGDDFYGPSNNPFGDELRSDIEELVNSTRRGA